MFLSPPVVAVVIDRVDVESASGEEGGERVRAVVAAGEEHQHAAGCPCGFAASRGGIELAGGAGELCGAPDGCVVASFVVARGVRSAGGPRSVRYAWRLVVIPRWCSRRFTEFIASLTARSAREDPFHEVGVGGDDDAARAGHNYLVRPR